MPPLVNATSADVNPGLNELLSGIIFYTEHAINECCPLRLVSRVLQAVLLCNLAIGFTIVALDKRSNEAFEINGLIACLNDALANARGTEHIGMKHVVHIRAFERKGPTLRATVFNLARIGIEILVILVNPHRRFGCALCAGAQIGSHALRQLVRSTILNVRNDLLVVGANDFHVLFGQTNPDGTLNALVIFVDGAVAAVVNQQDIAELGLEMRAIVVERNGTVVGDHRKDEALAGGFAPIFEHVKARRLELNTRFGKIRSIIAVGLVAKVSLLDKSAHAALVLLGSKVLGRTLPFRRNTELEDIAKRHPVEIGSIPLDARGVRKISIVKHTLEIEVLLGHRVPPNVAVNLMVVQGSIFLHEIEVLILSARSVIVVSTINGHSSDWRNVSEINIAELFAGVGGFRLGLEGYADPRHPEFYMKPAGPFHTIWANQWEPPGTKSRQFAARCYMDRFGEDSVVNEDINKVLEQAEAGEVVIPDVQMVVGGFPCQDYSVARPLNQAHGIEGKKGVLWWDIYHFLEMKKPRFGLFENVDRLLKSPASQRGRDFAIILSCLADLDYTVEWRVVNSAEYGFPQRRKRVYIFCEKNAGKVDLADRMHNGVMAKAFPGIYPDEMAELGVLPDPYENSTRFGVGQKTSQFKNAGVMQGCHVLTCDFAEDYHGERRVLGDVLVDEANVPEQFYISDEKLPDWRYLKGSKREERTNKKTGFTYTYSEGAMSFPDATDKPSRTILTGEGGTGASRFKHVIECPDGRFRRLVPDELDQLQGFPKGWTDTGMTDGHRAFCMGNALVTGVPHRIGEAMVEVYGL